MFYRARNASMNDVAKVNEANEAIEVIEDKVEIVEFKNMPVAKKKKGTAPLKLKKASRRNGEYTCYEETSGRPIISIPVDVFKTKHFSVLFGQDEIVITPIR